MARPNPSPSNPREFSAARNAMRSAARQIAADVRFDRDWICKSGLWPDATAPQAAVLKLRKRPWSQDPVDAMVSTSGIFFSVWVDRPALERGGLNYNVHALKLRGLAGYALESRKFAAAFRAHFAPVRADWPNVAVAFGPRTLLQGFVACPPDRTAAVTCDLARQFFPLGVVIDTLLAVARRELPAKYAKDRERKPNRGENGI